MIDVHSHVLPGIETGLEKPGVKTVGPGMEQLGPTGSGWKAMLYACGTGESLHTVNVTVI